MKITVNGQPRELNIGCRSFVYVSQLIGFLDVAELPELAVVVNGKHIEPDEFVSALVKSADRVTITTAAKKL